MNHPNFYSVTPAYVRYCKELEMGARVIYGELAALANKEGYCWASNQYFADLYEVDPKTIQKWIRSLKDLNFIIVEVEMNGIQRTRKIWITDRIQNMFATPQNCGDVGRKIHPREEKNAPHINTSNTKTKKEYTPASPEGDTLPAARSKPPNRKKEPEDPIERSSGVFTTPKQNSSLLQKCGDDQKKLDACYVKLSDWKLSKELVGGSDFHHLVKWVIKAVEKEMAKPLPVEREEVDKALVEKIKKKLPKHQHVVYGHNYIELVRGMSVDHINFGEHGFKDRVLNGLGKMGLDTSEFR